MRTSRHRPRGRTAAATLLVAAAVALLAVIPLHLREQAGSADTRAAGAGRTAGVASAPPAARPSSSRPAAASRPFVPPSAPRVLEAPSIGLAAKVTPYTPEQVAEQGGAVDPSSLWAVAWWTGGGTPGSHADNTVYLYGHTWKEPAVFNRIKELEPGEPVFVTTRTGRLRYVVDDVFTVDKVALTDHPTVVERRPGRLLLLGCYRETGREERTTRNVVVVAHMGAGS